MLIKEESDGSTCQKRCLVKIFELFKKGEFYLQLIDYYLLIRQCFLYYKTLAKGSVITMP